jgi:hypothetical protein
MSNPLFKPPIFYQEDQLETNNPVAKKMHSEALSMGTTCQITKLLSNNFDAVKKQLAYYKVGRLMRNDKHIIKRIMKKML